MKQTAFITGAGGALGHALSLKLAETHQHIVLHDANLSLLEPVYDAIEAAGQGQPALFPLDFRQAGANEFNQLAQALEENYAQIDTLVLNAASLPAFTPLAHFDPMQWYEVLQINLNAHFHILQATLPLLKSGAAVIAISDEAIAQPKAYYGAYAVAKAGLEQLIRLLSSERDDLTCRIVRLPPFQSDLRQRLFPGADNTRLPSAKEMAQRVLDHL
ncbi:MAG TPA: SDR family NAD(P)-dependent oxidoreductase [Sulfurivirga caldicuralii]|nr:SDR family NAD(P)-dependent oxidoreductase [Sulfurivirga caldicuralii]